VTEFFNDNIVQECLKEHEYIEKIADFCDKNDLDYVSGLLAMNELDPNSDLYDPIQLLHALLVDRAELSSREAITLIDNAFNAMIDGIVSNTSEDATPVL
jgi:hypothetical protein